VRSKGIVNLFYIGARKEENRYTRYSLGIENHNVHVYCPKASMCHRHSPLCQTQWFELQIVFMHLNVCQYSMKEHMRASEKPHRRVQQPLEKQK